MDLKKKNCITWKNTLIKTKAYFYSQNHESFRLEKIFTIIKSSH